jgi:ABC-type transporter MlaC component
VAQRQDFAAVLSGNGVDGLLAALRARTDHLPATASR